MEKNREFLEKQHERDSALFWDRKARLTYYLLSLPFALFGGAIASYKPTHCVEFPQLFIEVFAWVFFLISGLSGLISKWGEMETARMSSIISQSELKLLKRDQNAQKRTEQSSKLSTKQENKRCKAEKAESLGNLFLKILLPIGCVLLIISRILLNI